LPEPHNARLVETFADGPCFGYLHRWRRNRQTKVISQPGKFARGLATAVAFLFGLPRPISMIDGKRIHPAAAITVHDPYLEAGGRAESFATSKAPKGIGF